MQKTRSALSLLIAVAISSATLAGVLSSESPSSDAKTSTVGQQHQGTPSVTEDLVSVDVTGVMSCDAEGELTNTVIALDLFAELGVTNPGPSDSVLMTGVGWDLVQSTNTTSWLSEMTIGFDYEGDGINDLFLTPSTTDDPGVNEPNSSGGIINLIDAGLGNGVIPSGTVLIEFFESYDDDPGLCEATYNSGMVTLDVFAVPEPNASVLSILLIVGLVVSRRR